MTFSSGGSNDPDGIIVAEKWWFNNEIVSTDFTWSSSFADTGIYQIKLEVQDDNGVWSSKLATTFKIIANTPPTIDFTISGEGFSFVFNSSATDLEGTVVQFEWLIGWNGENQTILSYEQNSTWTTNQTGTYNVTFRAMDDGGLWSEDSVSIESKVLEQKNFVAFFSSKNIEPGETFSIDFSETKGGVEKFVIVVNHPNGSQESHETSNSKYTLLFEKEGKYARNVQ